MSFQSAERQGPDCIEARRAMRRLRSSFLREQRKWQKGSGTALDGCGGMSGKGWKSVSAGRALRRFRCDGPLRRLGKMIILISLIALKIAMLCRRLCGPLAAWSDPLCCSCVDNGSAEQASQSQPDNDVITPPAPLIQKLSLPSILCTRPHRTILDFHRTISTITHNHNGPRIRRSPRYCCYHLPASSSGFHHGMFM